VLAACGGSGGNHAAPLAPAAVATKTPALSSVHISLTIPARSTLSRRRTTYISPSTQSMLFTVAPGAVQTKINLTGSICTTSGTTGDKSCTFGVTAPVGNDTVTVVAYDQPFNGSGVLPGGTNALSGASAFAVTVTEGANNVSVPLITGGVPATAAVGLATGVSSASFSATATSAALTVTAYDADGNIIIAPGAFSDASGNPVPLTIDSLGGTTGFGYAVTSAATGTTGSPGATIALAEPDDTVALVWNGTSYVPATDTLTLQNGVTNHDGGATTTAFSFGYRFTPSSTPSILLPLSSAIATSVGHHGIAYVAQPDTLAFAGDVKTACTLPSIESGSVTSIGGATFDAPATPTDTGIYVSAADNGERVFEEYPFSAVLAGGACNYTIAYGVDSSPPGGFAAAGNAGISVSSAGQTVIDAMTLNPLGESPAVTYQIALFTPRAVGELPSGGSGFVQFDDKKQIVSVNSGAAVTSTQALAGMTDGVYPTGMTVDANGNIYANDTHSAMYGSNGGVDSFTTLASGPNGSAQLQSPIQSGGPASQLQNMASGPYAGGTALYVACGDGIEVFPVTATGFSGSAMAPAKTIALPTGGTSVVANADGRMWVLLSDGSLDALPPQ
jgi:hypothetical protein